MTGDRKLIDEYRQLHASRLYGATSIKNLRFIRPEIRLLRPQSILDYGCGQSPLIEQLALGYPCDLSRYDPAIPAFSAKPHNQFDLLLNIDVLEHIEERDLDAVIAEMRRLCRNAIIIVDTRPANATLSDGRNAHVTLRPCAWWRNRLGAHFAHLEPIATVRRSRVGFKTWSRGPADTFRYAVMRVREDAVHFARRAVRR